MRVSFPRVLDVEIPVGGGEGECAQPAREVKALAEVAVVNAGVGPVVKDRDASQGHVHGIGFNAAVVVHAAAAEEVDGAFTHVVDVGPKLEGMAAAHPTEVVRPLVAVFIRKGLPGQEVAHAATINVQLGVVEHRGPGGIVALELKVAPVLEAELVHRAGAGQRSQPNQKSISAHAVEPVGQRGVVGAVLGLNAIGRAPLVVVVLDGEALAGVDVPVNLAQRNVVQAFAVERPKFIQEKRARAFAASLTYSGTERGAAELIQGEAGVNEETPGRVPATSAVHCDAGEVAVLLVVVQEPEHFVLLDRAAHRKAELLPGVFLFLESIGLADGLLGVEGVVADEVKRLAVEGVSAALGDGVHGAAGGAPELGGEVAGADLEFFDGRLTHGVGGAGAAASLGEEGLVVVSAVHHVVVVEPGDAAVAHQAEVAVGLYGGREQHKVLPAPAVDGQVFDRDLRDGDRVCGPVGLDDGRVFHNGDDLGRRCHLQGDVDRGGRADFEHDARVPHGGEAGLLHRNFILARAQIEGLIPSHFAGGQRPLHSSRHVAHHYLCAGNDRAGGVLHHTHNLTARNRLGLAGGREAEQSQNQKCPEQQSGGHTTSLGFHGVQLLLMDNLPCRYFAAYVCIGRIPLLSMHSSRKSTQPKNIFFRFAPD